MGMTGNPVVAARNLTHGVVVSMSRKSVREFVGLTLTLSLVMTLIFCLTILLFAGIVAMTTASGLVSPSGDDVVPLMAAMLLASIVVVGAIAAYLVRRVSLDSLEELSGMVDELGRGNFGARVTPEGRREVRELGEKLNQAAATLESVEVLRNDFLATYSRKSEAAIASIESHLEALDHEGITDAGHAEHLDAIATETKTLATLLAYAQRIPGLEEQLMHPSPTEFSLTGQVRDTVASLRPRWEEKNLAMSVDLAEVTMTGDEGLLGLAWKILLEDAIRLAPRSGGIRVSLRSVKDGYEAKVVHPGPGEGSVGLAFVHGILQLHGGSLSQRTDREGVTRTTVFLPWTDIP